MSEQRTLPYPGGTRVILVRPTGGRSVGSAGTATTAHGVQGVRPFANLRSPLAPGTPVQLVRWDDGGMSYRAVRDLRPIEDPDAEPVTTEQTEELTA